MKPQARASRDNGTWRENDQVCCRSRDDQGMHRFLADGVHYRDIMDIRASAADWASLPQVWSDMAEAAEKRGDARSRPAPS